jgi:hypothetical protein
MPHDKGVLSMCTLDSDLDRVRLVTGGRDKRLVFMHAVFCLQFRLCGMLEDKERNMNLNTDLVFYIQSTHLVSQVLKGALSTTIYILVD